MLLVIFLFFVAIFLISGVFISLEGKRRRAHSSLRSVPLTGSGPRVGRATPDND